jgi:hypothetical protein
MCRGLQVRSGSQVSGQQITERFRHFEPVLAEPDPNGGAGGVGVLDPHRDEAMHRLTEQQDQPSADADADCEAVVGEDAANRVHPLGIAEYCGSVVIGASWHGDAADEFEGDPASAEPADEVDRDGGALFGSQERAVRGIVPLGKTALAGAGLTAARSVR